MWKYGMMPYWEKIVRLMSFIEIWQMKWVYSDILMPIITTASKISLEADRTARVNKNEEERSLDVIWGKGILWVARDGYTYIK